MAAVVSSAAAPSHLYVTWVGSEPDKAAAAWFIKRHVDPAATFELQPPSTVVEKGTPFDVPQARYRRVHNASTLEMLLRDHPSQDPVIRKMALITHDIEINLWRPKVFPESLVIDARMKQIEAAHGSAPIPVDCMIALFDNVYAWLKAQRTESDELSTPSDCTPQEPIK